MFLKKTNLEECNNTDILLLGEWAKIESDNDFKILSNSFGLNPCGRLPM